MVWDLGCRVILKVSDDRELRPTRGQMTGPLSQMLQDQSNAVNSQMLRDQSNAANSQMLLAVKCCEQSTKISQPRRCQEKREQLEGFKSFNLRDQILVLTVLYVPNSLDSGQPTMISQPR